MRDLPTPIFVDSREQLDRLLQMLMAQEVVAVDTESNSLYAYYERICLIQLSIPGADYILDPLADLDARRLGDFFSSSDVQKVFHAAEQDVAGLRRDFDVQVKNLFDTMWAARILGWSKVGLANILRDKFHVQTDKRYQRHNWGERPINSRALTYAQLDTHYLLELRGAQLQDLTQKGRLEEAEEVFAGLAQTPASTNPFGPDAFWRVKGRHRLSGREQAVLWELYTWRDQLAERRNSPPFRIMGDKRLIAIAQVQPRTLTELENEVGLKHRVARRYGDALLTAVQRGLKGPVPRPHSGSRTPDNAVMDRYQALRTWRIKAAKRRQVESDVILPNAVLWALAESDPTSLQDLERVEGFGPWKRGMYGEDVLRVLRAERRD